MEIFSSVAAIISFSLNAFALLAIIITPIRERLFGVKKINDGRKCLLRSEMLRIYYENKNAKTIRQYEYENFLYLYAAYKALKGNSFVDDINTAVRTWQIIS